MEERKEGNIRQRKQNTFLAKDVSAGEFDRVLGSGVVHADGVGVGAFKVSGFGWLAWFLFGDERW